MTIMTRADYIRKLDEIRTSVCEIGARFNNSRIEGETEMEGERRKVVTKLFDKIETLLYDNGAVSMRIREENLAHGIGEQGDLFEVHPDGEVDDGEVEDGETDEADDIEESSESAPTNPPTDITKVETCFTTKEVGGGLTELDFAVAKADEDNRKKATKSRKTKGAK